jgi:hypothetical protein
MHTLLNTHLVANILTLKPAGFCQVISPSTPSFNAIKTRISLVKCNKKLLNEAQYKRPTFFKH